MGKQRGKMRSPEPLESPPCTHTPNPFFLLRMLLSPGPQVSCPQASRQQTLAKVSSQSPSSCCDPAAPPALRKEPVSFTTVPPRPLTNGGSSHASTSPPPPLSA